MAQLFKPYMRAKKAAAAAGQSAPLGRYTDVLTGEPRGIWRRPVDGSKPKSLGPTANCIIRLWPEAIEHVLVLGEGVETTLAAATRIMWNGAYLRPAWAAGNSNNMATFPIVPNVEFLIILVDHDANGAGERASEQVDVRWASAGRQTQRLMPESENSDFNDMVKP